MLYNRLLKIKMVWLETPTNPTLKLIDIKAVCEIAKRKNPKIITIVDNTFASAYFQVSLTTFLNSCKMSKMFILHSESIRIRS